jgi:hypothetical protein
MNKNEFIQRGILALMANPNAYGHDSNILRMAPARLIQEAQDMAEFVEQEGIPFDALPMNDGYVHTPLGNFRLSVDKEEPEEIELNKSNILDTFTKKHPLRVTSEFHMIPECFEEIFNATMRDRLFQSCTFDGKEISATISHSGPFPIITNWYDVENEKAPNGSWAIFGIPHTSSTPLMVFVLDDQWREDLFKEGRAVRVTPNTKP